MTRLHPFDHAFAALADTQFAEIAAEAESQRRDPRDRVQFAALSTVQQTLQAIEDPALLASDPTAATAYLAVLFGAFNFWSGGSRTIAMSQSTIDARIEAGLEWLTPPVADVDCYVQLPEHRFWAQIDTGAPHEPLDGLFVCANTTTREMLCVAAMGVRDDRDGFSQLTVVAAFDDLAALAEELRRPVFAPTVDGGDQAGLKSVTTDGEVLALALLGLAVAPTS